MNTVLDKKTCSQLLSFIFELKTTKCVFKIKKYFFGVVCITYFHLKDREELRILSPVGKFWFAATIVCGPTGGGGY